MHYLICILCPNFVNNGLYSNCFTLVIDYH